MPDVMCAQAMDLLNIAFMTPIVFNDGHDIVRRLDAGDEVADIVEDLGKKFSYPDKAAQVRRVVEAWDPLHLEALTRVVHWALGKLDTDDRIEISWKGDDTAPETVTRFELRGHKLLIEFAHPAGSLPRLEAAPTA